jgi:hypothetical protein
VYSQQLVSVSEETIVISNAGWGGDDIETANSVIFPVSLLNFAVFF